MKNVLLFILFILFISCSNNSRIVDQDATRETKILFENMTKSAETRILFGHQDDLAYGIGWRNLQGESDVKRVTGFYPSVIGHDIGHIERDVNIDSVPFEQIRQYILENATDHDRFSKMLSVTLYQDGTVQLATPPISSYMLTGKCFYTFVDGELLICQESENIIARFKCVDECTLQFKSATVPLLADKGARYVSTPLSNIPKENR